MDFPPESLSKESAASEGAPLPQSPEGLITAPAPTTGWVRHLYTAENWLVSLCLAAMVALPLIEATLRKFFNTGVAASSSIVQHLCLVLGMLGGAIAARDARLLSLSTASAFLSGRAKNAAHLFGHAFGAAITILLCLASAQFVQQEKIGGNPLAYGVKRWMVEAVMPVGFGLIALRLLWNAAQRWKGRALAVAIAALVVGVGLWPPLAASKFVLPGLVLLLIATILGTPVFVTLGGAAVILLWGKGEPVAVMPIEHYRLVVNATLPTIPLFTLAGYLLAEGGASKRLVRVFAALVGHFRGGPAIATALVCAFFTSFTGASGVTILALGGLLMPVLLSAGYSGRNALGLLTGAGSLGLLLPPCLPLILYAIVAQVRIEDMFLGGILPGFFLVFLTAALGIYQSPRSTLAATLPAFDRSEAWAAILDAKYELLLPVVALVALFGGFATPLEASAVTAFYAFIIEVFVYRDLKIFRDLPRVFTECALLVGGVLLILGVALGFTYYLTDAQVPDKLLEWVKQNIHSKWVFLIALNVFLLGVGCLMDVFSAIVVVVPLMVPLGQAFGIHPIHLGILFLANLELGFLTPPVGMNLFLSSYRFNKPMSEVTRSIIPILLVLLLGVLVITYIPAMTTWLPGLIGTK